MPCLGGELEKVAIQFLALNGQMAAANTCNVCLIVDVCTVSDFLKRSAKLRHMFSSAV